MRRRRVDRGGREAPLREVGDGIQGVAAVVARPDQADDPHTLALLEPGGDHGREPPARRAPSARPRAGRPWRPPRRRGRRRRRRPRSRPSPPRRRRPTRCRRRARGTGGTTSTPRCVGARRDRAATSSDGRPSASVATVRVGQSHARPGRRATWRGPPWRRTGRPATRARGRARSSVKRRSRSAGVRSSVCPNRAMSTTSMPTPTITGARHSTVTDLARLRGWSTSRPLAVASSQREDLQRHDGEQRREQRRASRARG